MTARHHRHDGPEVINWRAVAKVGAIVRDVDGSIIAPPEISDTEGVVSETVPTYAETDDNDRQLGLGGVQ